jgi:hypothetical protein
MSLVLLGSTSGSVTLQEPAIAGSTTIDLPATSGTMAVLPTATSVLPQASGGTGTTTGYYGFKNRIINGAMVIDQRNAGASVSVANNTITYTADRWLVYSNNDGLCSMQQVSDAPSGFIKSLKFTTTTADASLSATQRTMIQQRVEGFNASDLGWGSASAATVTLSFWVKSSLTGTFGAAIQNESVNRSYPFTYTISSANTWEQKSITIAGDTTGTWATDNTSFARIVFGLGVGSTYSGTANAWAASDLNSVTGAVSVIGTLNATWQITGVQLEKGSTATSFDYRPYGTELALCQRYYARFNSLGGSYRGVGAGVSESATSISCVVKYPVSMRSGPTASGANMATYDGSSVRAITAFSTQYTGSDGLNMNFTVGGGGMTTNRPANLITDNSGTGYFELSAEL